MGTGDEELEEYRSRLTASSQLPVKQMFLVFPRSKHVLQTNQSILFLGKRFLSLCQEFTFGYEGYRMVFTSFCRHASSAFIFASTSSDQVCLASGEHFRKYRMQVASTFPIAGISLSLKRNLVRQGNVAYTSSKTVQ